MTETGRRRCLICCWPGEHVEAATHNGYIPHPYDPGERRRDELTDPQAHTRVAVERRAELAA